MMEAFILYTFKVSACLGAGCLLYLLLLRKETFHRVKRFCLLSVMAASLLIPLVRLPAGVPARGLTEKSIRTVIFREAPAEMPVVTPRQHVPVVSEPARRNPATILYLAGAALQILLITVSLARVALILRHGRTSRYNGIRLVLVERDIHPFAIGRTVVLSTAEMKEHGREVLIHEQAHIKAGHFYDLLLAELLLIITWYNPFTWLLRREIRMNHEFEADHTVLRHGTEPSGYQLLLVRRAVGPSRFSLASKLRQSNLKTRIAMMTRETSRPLRIFRILLFVPLALAAILVLAQKANPVAAPQAGKALPAYLVLHPDQLPLLGFEANSSGLFYKNTPSPAHDKKILCMYFTKKTYSANIVLDPGEKITGNSGPERILQKMPVTSHDFQPVLVTSCSGHRTLDMTAQLVDQETKLLPVQVNMAEVLPGGRGDTLVFWFPPTGSLKAALAPVADITGYLKPAPPDPNKAQKR